MEILPSLISADLLNLNSVIESLNDHCDGFHIDVMDNHFVPNLTWGPAFIDYFLKVSKKPLDVHLMVDNPESFIPKLSLRVDDTLIFHFEAVKDKKEIENLALRVQSMGWKVGLAIKPGTKFDDFAGFLRFFDQVLVMSVEPGFSNQKFISKVLDKIKKIAQLKQDKQFPLKMAVDGGVNCENIKLLVENGVDRVGVAGAIFSGDNYLQNLQKLYSAA